MNEGALSREHLEKTHNTFLYPVVRVVAPSKQGIAGGSGVLVYSAPLDKESSKYESYLITNHHVIANLIDIEDSWNTLAGKSIKKETKAEAIAEFFEYENLSRIVENAGKRAEVVAWDEARDLALLKLRATTQIQNVAPIVTPEEFDETVFITTPVYTVGCGLGVPPLITSGHVGGFNFLIDNHPYTLTTAPSIFGNSGGGVFDASTGKVIGITARISVVLMGLGASPITHMSWCISPQTVHDFLTDNYYDFIIDPTKTAAECHAKREEIKRKAEEKMLGGGDSDDE